MTEEIRQRKKEYARRYYQAHKAEFIAKSREWKRAHKDRVHESYLRTMERRGDEIRAQRVKYHLEHRAEHIKKYREYYKANIETVRAQCRSYAAAHKTEALERTRKMEKAHPLRSVHRSMMVRCGHWKGANKYKLSCYRDRGIFVCNEWHKFSAFEDWALSHGWTKGLQIDRIDNDRGYCPENCRFVTAKENSANRRPKTRTE